jgi:hypothetical protein
MSSSLNLSDFVAGFLFGSHVAQAANGIDRKRIEVMPNIRKCLEDVVGGDITLIDTPEETAKELGPVSDAIKKPTDEMLWNELRRAREAHKQQAAQVLAELRRIGI